MISPLAKCFVWGFEAGAFFVAMCALVLLKTGALRKSRLDRNCL